ncbi:PI-PLC X domain-containing protein At5g67130-like isoform X3 [Gastrolobium bilobum]|uniref:PI-PLC X domain-containing protein At5g67130-like isoform X3 n=1 Tax=Gastrolobium bilobum TaxID=150636 RepID=UPI002AB1EA02|nr:PI-PLC X domain-containing protein At5g67130-like isoform X3 [Gastrolobium bilobum]
MCSHFQNYRLKCRALAIVYLLLPLICSFFSNGNCQVLEACSAARDCGSGLYCGNCPALGLNQPICIRGQPTLPTSINGVRGLMLDMYDFQNDIWLCHSFRGQCFNFTAFQPAINTLKEVEAFLTENPAEIVTIIIEDYVHTPKGLTNVFTSAGLDKYWFPVSKIPKKGDDWPTVTEMVQANHRLLVFTSDASKEAEEGIAYQWKHMVENESGDPGVQQGSCPHRKESKALNSRGSSLFLMNYFPTYPVEADSCKEHSAPLAEMVNTCYKAAGNVLPNFIAVNFYMRSDGGGVFDIVDKMNGHTLCGCSTITACQAGAHFGSCKNISVPSASPMTNTAGGFTGSVQFSSSASPVHSSNCLLLFFYFLLFAVLLQL